MAFASATALTPIALTELSAISVAALSSADGTNGNKFFVNPGTLLRVKNGGESPITVTVHTTYQHAGLALPDKTFDVADDGDVIFQFGNPIDTFWEDRSTKQAWIEFSAATDVTVAVYQP